jgi:magnesium chelatase family protein
VPPVDFAQLTAEREGEPSERVRARVLEARARQRRRLAGTGLHANADLGPRDIARYCKLDAASLEHLGQVVRKRGLTARGVHRLLKVARTLADLGSRAAIARDDLQCAIDFRALDQEMT